MSRTFGLLAAVIATAVLLPSAALGQPEDGRAAISRAQAIVERASQAPEGERPGLARSADQELESMAGAPIARWLREPLRETPPDLAGARERLAAARGALDPGTTALPADARMSLDEILDGPPFTDWSWLALVPAVLLPVALLIQRAAELLWNAMRWPFDRLLELLDRLLEGLFSTAAVLVLALLATIGLVWLYRRGLRSAIVTQAEIAALALDLPPTSTDALETARQCAVDGRYRDACHFVFLSTLLWIEEQGEARFIPAATNREYLVQIAERPRVADALAPIVSRFDRVWYGQDRVGDDDYRELAVAAAQLRRLAR